MNSIAENIRAYRKSHNLTQRQLAEKIGVSHQTVSGWESARSMPDIDTLIKISEKLDVETDVLLYGRKGQDSDVKKELIGTAICLAVVGGIWLVLSIYYAHRQANSTSLELLFSTNRFYILSNRLYNTFLFQWLYILPVIVLCLSFKYKGILKGKAENKAHKFIKRLLISMVICWCLTRIICFGFTYDGEIIFVHLPEFLKSIERTINNFLLQYPWSLSAVALAFELTRPFKTDRTVLPTYSPGRKNTIAQNIKRIREEANLTQQQLADKMFVTRQTVSNWENGKVMPDIEKLMLLSQSMDIHLNTLLYSSNSPSVSLKVSVFITSVITALLSIVYCGYGLMMSSLYGSYSQWVGYAVITYRNIVNHMVIPMLCYSLAVLVVQWLKLKGRITKLKGFKYRKLLKLIIIVFLAFTLYAYIPTLVQYDYKELMRVLHPLVWLNYPDFNWLVPLQSQLAYWIVYIAKKLPVVYVILGLLSEISKPYNLEKNKEQ